MRVLLISPNRERLPDPVFPLGLSYVSSALKKDGHDVAGLDLCFEDDMHFAIRNSIEQYRPEVIGLSLRNIDNVAYPKSTCYLDFYKDVVRSLRACTDAKLVLGGAGLTIMPDAFMHELDADYAITGEGEAVLCDLLRELEHKFDPEKKIIKSDRAQSSGWNEMIPDRSLFDSQKYYEYGGMLNIQTKRGCPFRCIYCSYPLIEGRNFRMRAPESVADELETVVTQTGIRHFFIVDSVFNYPIDYAELVCDSIIRRHLDIQWTCYGNPAYMTDRLANKLRKAGCTSIEFGTDSLNDDILDILKKGFKYRHVVNASQICRNAGIKYCHFIFIGAPGDTADTVKLNLERLDNLSSDASIIMVGIRIFPRTGIESIAREDLGIDESSISINPLYYISPGVLDELDSIVEYIKFNHSKWILPGFEININERLLSLLRKTGIKGSLWEEFAKR